MSAHGKMNVSSARRRVALWSNSCHESDRSCVAFRLSSTRTLPLTSQLKAKTIEFSVDLIDRWQSWEVSQCGLWP